MRSIIYISPYAYVANNPLKFIDPTGMSMDDYYQTEDGRITLARGTDDNYDRLFGKDGSQIKVEDTNLLPQLAGGRGKDSAAAMTSNSNDAFNVFKFSADNTNVEWGLGAFKNNKGNIDYILNTSFDKEGVKLNTLGKDRSDMTFHIHSHPGGDNTKMASGYDLYVNGLSYGSSDAEFMKTQFNIAKNANKKWPSEYPRLYIYHKESGGIYHYNHSTSSEFVGNVRIPITLRSLVRNHKIKPK